MILAVHLDDKRMSTLIYMSMCFIIQMRWTCEEPLIILAVCFSLVTHVIIIFKGFILGAQHSSDLPFLFGPSLFKQISRKRLSQTEEKLCKKFKQLFGDFIKVG